MKTINCLIIDDKDDSIEQLSEQLKKIVFAEITPCTTYEHALVLLRKSSSYDIIFLDIELNGKSGLELLGVFPKLPPVIIISAYSEYAHLSYDADMVVDYLLKPCTNIRLLRSINRALSEYQNTVASIGETTYIFFKMGRKIMRFDYAAIEYIEAYGTYSKVFYKSNLIVINESISTVEMVLPKKQFIRVHKSYIINLSKVTSYDHKVFYINDIKVPMGASYKPYLEPFIRIFNE